MNATESGFVEAAQRALEEGRAGEAVALLERNLARGGGGIFARLLFVRSLIACGQNERALSFAREFSLLQPHLADAALALGEALLAKGALPLAIAEFQRALRLDPGLEQARELLARVWLEAGEPEKAEAALAGCAWESPELLARAAAMRARPRSDAGYVRHLFDQFSADYDRRMLGELGYAAPTILRSLADLVLRQKENLEILDLGCGTGLAGAVFKPLARRLVGIDLSPSMLEKARGRGIYDSLFEGDVESFDDRARYDILIAADTLVYLGDLAPVLDRAKALLRPGGYFLFTAEHHPGKGYRLGEKRRWQHSEPYVRLEAERTEFGIAGILQCVLRTERGLPVEGLACALEAP